VIVLILAALVMGWLLLQAVTAPAPGPAPAQLSQPGSITLPAAVPTSALDALARSQPLLVDARWEEAIAILAPAAEAYPNDQELHIAMSAAYQGLRRWDKALPSLITAIEIGPASATMHVQAGTIANTLGKLDAAAAHYARAQALEPTQARHPLFLAMIQIKQSKDAAATASLVRATVLDPDLAEAWGTLAELALRGNTPAMALQHTSKARALQPTVVRWRVVEARAHRRANAPQEAADVLVGLADADRLTPAVLTELTSALGMLRRPAEAAAQYEAAAARPGDHHAAFLLEAARWRQKAGDVAQSRALAAKAAAAGSKDAVEFLAGLE